MADRVVLGGPSRRARATMPTIEPTIATDVQDA